MLPLKVPFNYAFLGIVRANYGQLRANRVHVWDSVNHVPCYRSITSPAIKISSPPQSKKNSQYTLVYTTMEIFNIRGVEDFGLTRVVGDY